MVKNNEWIWVIAVIVLIVGGMYFVPSLDVFHLFAIVSPSDEGLCESTGGLFYPEIYKGDCDGSMDISGGDLNAILMYIAGIPVECAIYNENIVIYSSGIKTIEPNPVMAVLDMNNDGVINDMDKSIIGDMLMARISPIIVQASSCYCPAGINWDSIRGCLPMICAPNELRCNGNNKEQCNALGTAWNVVETCSYGCSGGICNPCVEEWACDLFSTCTNDLQLRTCIDSNSCGTTKDKPIESQSCTTFCIANSYQCHNFDREQCSSDGTAWNLIDSKSPDCGYICDSGISQCNGYDLYACSSNSWDIQPKSALCGYVCDDGVTKCDGYNLYACSDNIWIFTDSKSADCGYTCAEDWSCADWSDCIEGYQIRDCADENKCETIINKQETSQTCISLICTEGETNCTGFDLYTCTSNAWVLTASNSATCGYVVPSGGGGYGVSKTCLNQSEYYNYSLYKCVPKEIIKEEKIDYWNYWWLILLLIVIVIGYELWKKYK